MQKPKNACLTIAGIDPSNGAGLTRDILTFDSLNVNHFGICSALTIQDEDNFNKVKWIEDDFVLDQISFILTHNNINVIKIGIIKNIEILEKVILLISKFDSSIKIIWDPIIKSSSDFEFHKAEFFKPKDEILKQLTLITPNKSELIAISNKSTLFEAIADLRSKVAVMLKGGHLNENENEVIDTLYSDDKQYSFKHPRVPISLHGTGCRYSAAVAAYLLKGYDLIRSCRQASEYVYHALKQKQLAK